MLASKPTYRTTSPRQTRELAKAFLRSVTPRHRHATVIGLVGELGAGKTTFVQGAAEGLGLRVRMPSPTFLIQRNYPLPRTAAFRTLYHFDWYRIHTKRELDTTEFFRILGSSHAMVLVEWADRIKRYLPKDAYIIHLRHGKDSHERIIKLPPMR